MKKPKRLKNKRPSEMEIKKFCLGVEEVLKTINERCESRKSRKKREKELVTSSNCSSH